MPEPSRNQNNSADISVDVLIVGAGFSGICMGIKLLEAGMKNFLIIEKSDDLGGTWYENHYPGCACDVPAHLYSFSFERNPDWTRMFAGQQEIWQYLKSCVQRYGLTPHIRFKTRFREGAWNEAMGQWRVTLNDVTRDNGNQGKTLTVRARVLVSGMGALHVPHYPEIPGIERFSGPSFHSATWRSDVDLTGKAVAVVGTGASAVQFIPHIAPRAGKLYIFQRTPPWVVPRLDFGFTEKARQRFRRIPALTWAFRKFLFLALEWRVLSFLGDRVVREYMERIARRHMERSVKDPKLRTALTPRYQIGCKRILLSDDFYPVFKRRNVELVTETIAEVREHSVVTQDGTERSLDVLIYGTGFHVTEQFIGMKLFGKNGLEIHNAWRNGLSAYLGVAVSGFPNFFMLLGPNTGLGHNSVVLMIEAQVRYVVNCLKLMRKRDIAALEVRAESQKHFNANLRDHMARTVWQSGGCHSWYQDVRTGENTTLWPGSVIQYFRAMRSVSLAEYDLRPARPGH